MRAEYTLGPGQAERRHVTSTARALLECAEAAFWRAVREVKAGAPLARVGGAVESEVRRRGFRVLRELCGLEFAEIAEKVEV